MRTLILSLLLASSVTQADSGRPRFADTLMNTVRSVRAAHHPAMAVAPVDCHIDCIKADVA